MRSAGLSFFFFFFFFLSEKWRYMHYSPDSLCIWVRGNANCVSCWVWDWAFDMGCVWAFVSDVGDEIWGRK
ncbi:uncharacterized protein BO72DRAFT_54626 [Aspergillus fijiensis CBS 313.89]|uniref:Secreted protein n=1 Tax=Aspergillus fijiensis CBS 313.89 TaxID=1448319 RepID=A0A8G1W0C5_9EURO|nr:uncharacterized protein BO72DRAFT_54626 [Aspergillus fijiensis CBS 313.89]RAK79217.1 hypothetical protein BO72DRAFT_54626 [Aspergillus fijiensis CBS 313.89]